MYSVETPRSPGKNRFDSVAELFLQQPGLPFAEVLTGEAIEQAFARRDALFAQNHVFSTAIVLWAFLAQVLRGGRGAACAAAVTDIAIYPQQTAGRVPSGDTGDYCRARAKLNLTALHELVVEAAQQLEDGADPSWHRQGLHAKLIDGFTFTMPDTPENQAEFPQQKKPKTRRRVSDCPGLRRVVAGYGRDSRSELRTLRRQGNGRECSAARHSGLPAGGRRGRFRPLLLFLYDAGPPAAAGVHFCACLHQLRSSDFRRGRRLGRDDHVVTWTRPPRPADQNPDRGQRP